MTHRIAAFRHAPALARLAAGLLLAMPASLDAQLSIDLYQPVHGTHPYTDSQANPWGQLAPHYQSFIPNYTTIAGGGFWWHNGFPGVVVECPPAPCQTLWTTAAHVEISLYSSIAPPFHPFVLPPLNLLAQTTVLYDLIGFPNGAWIDGFWDPVVVTPGETYFLGVRTILAPVMSGPGFTNSNYQDGSAYIWDHYLDLTGLNIPPGGYYDLTFRTWTTTAPEPSTYALMAVGLLAIAVVARRHRVS